MSKSTPRSVKKEVHSDSDDEDYEVEKILDKRATPLGGIEYLVKWQGQPMEKACWENVHNFSNPEKIYEYERERAAKKMARQARPAPDPTAAKPRDDATMVEIMGISNNPGEKYFTLKFSDGTGRVMTVSEVHARYPQEALAFYERVMRPAKPGERQEERKPTAVPHFIGMNQVRKHLANERLNSESNAKLEARESNAPEILGAMMMCDEKYYTVKHKDGREGNISFKEMNAKFPNEALRYCLEEATLNPEVMLDEEQVALVLAGKDYKKKE